MLPLIKLFDAREMQIVNENSPTRKSCGDNYADSLCTDTCSVTCKAISSPEQCGLVREIHRHVFESSMEPMMNT